MRTASLSLLIAVALLALVVGVLGSLAAPAAATPTPPAAGNASEQIEDAASDVDFCELNPERCEDGERITPTPEPTPDTDNGGLRLSSQLAVISTEMQGDEAVLVLYSDVPQVVTITDAGLQGIEEGEQIPRVTQRIDGRATIRLRVHSVRGTAGVTVDSERAFAPVWIEKGTTLIGGPWDVGDVWLSGLAGLVSGIVVIPIIVTAMLRRRKLGRVF